MSISSVQSRTAFQVPQTTTGASMRVPCPFCTIISLPLNNLNVYTLVKKSFLKYYFHLRHWNCPLLWYTYVCASISGEGQRQWWWFFFFFLLPFIFKTIEHAIFLHFPTTAIFLTSDRPQQTALLGIVEDLYTAKEVRLSSVIILLDISEAFDTVNQQIFLSTF